MYFAINRQNISNWRLNLTNISLAAIARMVKQLDSEIRIGVNSKNELRNSVEDYAKQIAKLAISIARRANRNTVLPQDIVTAREQLMI